MTQNRDILERTHLLDTLAKAADATVDDPEGRGFLNDTIEQLKHALNDESDQVDVVSSRLLWMCVALSYHVRAGRLTHVAAVRWLERPDTRERMTPRAVLYLLKDYLDSMDELDDSRSEYVALMAECALLADDLTCLKISAVLMRAVPPAIDFVSWMSTWRRLRARLVTADAWQVDDQAALDRTARRFEDSVPDHDF
ncbi:hypothetical protein [Frankia sp. CiP3]|uniref:hypothetical protein n=1 Tax=Frankia sp. CiP3 TaxID=2880971 RepID=UPI001EF74472|nr:hypothetical protein [Frankia sp. CiP3]